MLMQPPELDERQRKLLAFNTLVHRLPRQNLALLRALAQFLIVIVNNSDVNKMTVRNVGIVFAPTLNIPAPVLLMFLTDFDTIFDQPPRPGMHPQMVSSRSLSAQDIRSPRRQIFSDLPTPGYNQGSFRQQENFRDAAPQDDLAARNPTGFISMQPNYDQPYRYEAYQGNGMPHRMLSPDSEPSNSKAKRRESSFLFMEGNQGNQRSPSISPAADHQSKHCPCPEATCNLTIPVPE